MVAIQQYNTNPSAQLAKAMQYQLWLLINSGWQILRRMALRLH